MHGKTQLQMFNTGVETFHQFVSFGEQNRFKSEQKVMLAQSHFSGKPLEVPSYLGHLVLFYEFDGLKRLGFRLSLSFEATTGFSFS
jgi:hypothetical protein